MKTVLVTGCSSGFGKDLSRVFSEKGWNVAATMRTPEGESSERLLVTKLDVEDRESIHRAVEDVVARFGGIDVLINNAGFGLFGVFEETPRERLETQFAVNLLGLMDVTRAVLPVMRAKKSGVIVNVTSGAGVIGFPMMSAYCASKFAVEGFSESLAYELASVGIIVKIAEPGGVTTTKFGERSAAEAGLTTSIDDYAPFKAKTNAVFDAFRAAPGRSTSEEVAQRIYEAATDGTDRLRYLLTKDIEPLVTARRSSSEAEYAATTRSLFTPGL